MKASTDIPRKTRSQEVGFIGTYPLAGRNTESVVLPKTKDGLFPIGEV